MKKIYASIDRQDGDWTTIVAIDAADEVTIPTAWLPNEVVLDSVIEIQIRLDEEKKNELEEEIMILRKAVENKISK